MWKLDAIVQLSWLQLLAIVLFAATISLFLWSPGLRAAWWIIDDHEIQQFIGSAERMPLVKLIPNILSTEVGQPGTNLRFRPGYYLMRLLECLFWGKAPALWYGFRLVLFFVALSISIALFARLIGLPLGMVLALVLLCHSCWGDIFARLGPAETYAVLGLPLYCLAFSIIRRSLGNPQADDEPQGRLLWAWMVTICVASLLTAGSKENFTLLAVPSSYLLYRAARRHRSVGQPGMATIGVLAINLLIPLVVIVAVGVAVMRSGHDIYWNPVTLGDRLRLLIHFLPWNRLSAHSMLGMSLFVIVTAMLTAPSSYLLYRAVRPHRSVGQPGMATIGVLAINLLIPLVVIVAIGVAVMRSGHDIYWNPVALGDRLRLLIHFLSQWNRFSRYIMLGIMLGISLLVMVAAITVRLRGSDAERTRLLERGTYIQLSLVALYFSQYVFYNGRWPNGTRYDYPGVLIPDISLALSIYLFSKLIPRQLAIAARVAGVLLLCSLAFCGRGTFVMNRELSKTNALNTRNFTQRMQIVTHEASMYPERPIMLESHAPSDYEPVISVLEFLRVNHIVNPVQLKVIGYSGSIYPPGSLEQRLATRMEVISNSGDRGFTALRSDTSDMFTIGFSGEASGEPHHNLGRIF